MLQPADHGDQRASVLFTAAADHVLVLQTAVLRSDVSVRHHTADQLIDRLAAQALTQHTTNTTLNTFQYHGTPRIYNDQCAKEELMNSWSCYKFYRIGMEEVLVSIYLVTTTPVAHLIVHELGALTLHADQLQQTGATASAADTATS